MTINGRFVWVYDNSHDVVLAHVIEVAEADPDIDDTLVENWRVLATISDIALTYPTEHDIDGEAFLRCLEATRERVLEAGDLDADALKGWSVLDGYDVSDGFVRGGRHPMAALLDTVDGFRDMLTGTLEPDPENGAWFLGAPEGRSTIGMSGRDR